MTDNDIDSNGQNFEIRIDFVRHSPNPARIFRAMAGLIDSTANFHSSLAWSLAAQTEVDLLLEDVQAGSIRTVLCKILKAIDKEALRDGDWKKVIGRLLDDGREYLIEKLRDEPRIDRPQQLLEIQTELQLMVAQSKILFIAAPRPIPLANILGTISSIRNSISYLQDADEAYFNSAGKVQVIPENVIISPELETLLLVRETKVTEVRAILKVKKPDYIGQSKWEVYYSGHPIKVPIEDAGWLSNFQAAKQDLNPGDSLLAKLEISTKYGQDGQVVSHAYRVLKVYAILSGLSHEQPDLPYFDA